ncbi:hypothetical protein [Arthrobacter sp. efr-133-TYG-120]|uniref:hypothetical protein n=1 Tax=Arthrobacter sp. efr-133-TYG-120 TaxID=3040280 RepID=UPI00254E5E57|nr:hypothetical protein [Arthrobacter sp. efr-133-TYG-120]
MEDPVLAGRLASIHQPSAVQTPISELRIMDSILWRYGEGHYERAIEHTRNRHLKPVSDATTSLVELMPTLVRPAPEPSRTLPIVCLVGAGIVEYAASKRRVPTT